MSLKKIQTADVLVIGAGPIGLETAVALKQSGLQAIVLEQGFVGNTMHWWAPHTRWFSSNERIAIAGVPLMTIDQAKCTREQYLAYLTTVARQFQLDIRCRQRVVQAERGTHGWRLLVDSLGQNVMYEGSALVLATGGTDHPRRLNVPGEELPHVDHYLREPHRYFGRRVLIVGGRNSAVEAALRLYHAGAQVSLCHRRSEFSSTGIKYWLLPEIKTLLSQGAMKAWWERRPAVIHPSTVILRAATDQGQSRGDIQIDVDDVLVLIGFEQDKTLFRQLGVTLIGENQHPEFDATTMQTNLPGVYVAGTAIAGTQSSSYQVFLENCHEHPGKIAAHLSGKRWTPPKKEDGLTSPTWEPET